MDYQETCRVDEGPVKLENGKVDESRRKKGEENGE